MRKLMLLSTLAVAVLVLGLSVNRPAAAEQSTVEPDTVSSNVSEATPASLALDPEDVDSALDSKRGRIGEGRGGGHLGRSVGHHGPRTHARTAHHSGHHGHHPGHHIHHPRHHHRVPVGLVSWVEPEVEIEGTECIECPTITRPVCQVCPTEETEVETEELEQDPEEER
ncbi:MAG: hypothetical protein ACLQPD_02480 [Desulfomonilaceae bacterium]